jgi:hypothetical protein
LLSLTPRLLTLTLVSIFISACGIVQNPFKGNDSWRKSACDIDVTAIVELDRASFDPPEIWSRLKPCGMVKVSRQFRRDSWGISATLHYTYADVLVYDAGMGFGVEGNLNWIGGKPSTLEGWRDFEDNKWQRYMEKRGDSEKREVEYASKNSLDCWREREITYEIDKNISAISIAYKCWQPDKYQYPPLTIGGWIRYRDGKPVYDLDIDKDLIDPVFATLVVKDIKPEVYAERMAIYNEKMKEDCEWRKKDLRKNRFRAFNDYEIKRLEECGYDTTKLKREEE